MSVIEKDSLHITFHQTPLGIIKAHWQEEHLVKIERANDSNLSDIKSTNQFLQNLLSSYFSGENINWSQELSIKFIQGTVFQKKVWQTLCELGPGEIITYGQIASKIKNPKAVRAVGTAVGANPIPIIIPCHRVLPQTSFQLLKDKTKNETNSKKNASDFPVGGFAWGKTAKTLLLKTEKIIT